MTLEIQENHALRERGWLIQRCGWAVMALIVVATFLGLTGPGPLGERSERSAAGLQLEYDRFVRVEAPATLELTLPAPSSGQARVPLVLDRGWLKRVHLETVVPEPVEITPAGDQLLYTLPAGSGPLLVTLHFEPETWGPLEGTIGLLNEAPLSVSQFAYP